MASRSLRISAGPLRSSIDRSIKTSSIGSPGCWSSNRSSKSNCNQANGTADRHRSSRRKRRREAGSVRGTRVWKKQSSQVPLPLVDGLVLEVVGRGHHLSGWGIHGRQFLASAGERRSPGRKRCGEERGQQSRRGERLLL